MNKQKSAAIAAAAGMLMLILDGRTALAGVREGVDICLSVLIPSLFPYLVFSGLLTGTMAGTGLPLLRPLGQLLGIPAGQEQLLAIGALGGYPVGAQNVAQAYRDGTLTREDAARMLAFCSNGGPAFLFGMLGPLFDDPAVPWALWAVHLVSAVLVGLSLPAGPREGRSGEVKVCPSLPTVLERVVKTMALICGWVIFFRLILAFLDRWLLWGVGPDVSAFIAGILELSNGCIRLGAIGSDRLRFLYASVFLALGGCCVGLQTASVAAGLPLGHYFLGKGLQTVYALLLSLSILLHPLFLLPALVFPILLRRVRKNRGSISAPAIV